MAGVPESKPPQGELVEQRGDAWVRCELPVEPAVPLAHVFEMLPYGLRVPGGRGLPQTFYGAAGRIVQAVPDTFGEGIEGPMDAFGMFV
jgi:hypothetical protein